MPSSDINEAALSAADERAVVKLATEWSDGEKAILLEVTFPFTL
jgi:hypothetical protein